MAVTWASRTERPDGKTSPEELIAAAHASCFAMVLSHVLAEVGTPPERPEISAVCTFDVDNVRVSSVDLEIRGRVQGMDARGFQTPSSRRIRAAP